VSLDEPWAGGAGRPKGLPGVEARPSHHDRPEALASILQTPGAPIYLAILNMANYYTRASI
jgi:hypothetical protein